MKIAQVSAYWGPAYPTGSGVFCYEISKRLAKQFEVHAFTSSVGDFRNLNSDGINLHPLRTYATIWNMNPVADVFSKLLWNNFDIIHAHSYIFFMSNMSALARAFKRNSRYILHFHGGLDFSSELTSSHPGRIWAKEHVYDKTLGRFTTRLADKVLSVSKNDIPLINRKFGISEVEWMPIAVDTEKFVPAREKPEPPVITYVGKLEKWKGIDTLIETFKLVSKEVKNVKFLVVGTGSMEKDLREAQLPIEFSGAVPYEKMPEVYQRTSVLVLPSYMEGFPVTCVEAQACAVPLVTTDVGDTKEIVINGETGFLAKTGDAQEVASHLIKIVTDKKLREQLGETGRMRVKQSFSYEVVVEKLIAMYQECLK